MDNGRISGVIDWSNTAFGYREFDVAVSRLILMTGLAELIADPELRGTAASAFIGAYDAAYRQRFQIDENLVAYYTVLRGGHALARVIAARSRPPPPDAAHQGYSWSRSSVYETVRNIIAERTGIDVGAQSD